MTKPFTAVAAMRQAELGRLDLDTPVHHILDPWLTNQGLPNLSDLWNGDATITLVTARHLLGMQSGLGDYVDSAFKNFTVTHPHTDILPMDFLNALNKSFLYNPGDGASYSGDGFILLGMVLSAVTGAARWGDFDQLKALGELRPPLNQTTFMGRGPCSQYPHVVHQYTLRPGARESQEGVTAADFVDLYSCSCLNGWTMGNIAVTVRDAARFFHMLGSGQLTSAETLLEMQDWHNLTQGFGVGSLQYGLGLLNKSNQIAHDVTGATVNWTHHWGHDGVDWGSKSTLNGYYPNLDAAVVLAQNTEGAMNFSVPGKQGVNHTTWSYGGHATFHCLLENAVLQFVHPDAPALAC
jgi:CubicO group peptidase (beta-lactamase class C family)